MQFKNVQININVLFAERKVKETNFQIDKTQKPKMFAIKI